MNEQVGEWNNSKLSPWDQVLQMITQRLDIPATFLHVPKGHVAGDSGQAKKEIRLNGNTVLKGRGHVLGIYCICFNGYGRLYFFTLTGLDEKEFGFVSQSRTLLSCEVRHDLPDGNEVPIRRVDSSKFPMGQNTEHKAVSISMAWMSLKLLQNLL